MALVLLAGATAALAHHGGGGSDHHAERRAPLPTTAARAATAHIAPEETTPRDAMHPPGKPVYPDQPISTAGAARAVNAFTIGFLAWSQGRAPASAITHATREFITQARAHPPNVTPAEQRERTRVVRIRVVAGHPPVAVVDLAPSGGMPYELDFYLTHADGRWQISQLATPGG